MKVNLMFNDRDFDPGTPLPANEPDLSQDLELHTLFDAMAQGDKFLYAMVRIAVLNGLTDPDAIRYRQDILRDCLRNPEIVRQIYQIPIDAEKTKRSLWLGIFTRTPSGVLSSSRDLMRLFVDLLRQLKSIADDHGDKFESAGFRAFFAMLQRELSDEYFDAAETHLKNLSFRDGVLISAELGRGNEGTNYVLRLPKERNQGWLKDMFAKKPPVYSFRIHPRDNAGSRALSEIKDRGLNLAANALAQASDHIDGYLKMLQMELAFYIGCMNLHERLVQFGGPVSFPDARPMAMRCHTFRDLYDPCLALTMGQAIVGNDMDGDGISLAIITGANQGGKSTFLRSIGLGQLMMQAGMFVAAAEFRANACAGVFTHFKRKEDASMMSGKLDEELARMSTVVDLLTPGAVMLFNESFAATNEREGSEIAGQITRALVESGVKVFFVTHMYEFARAFFEQGGDDVLFLRAERRADGTRTFRLVEASPLPTSFGKDIYQAVFREKKAPAEETEVTVVK